VAPPAPPLHLLLRGPIPRCGGGAVPGPGTFFLHWSGAFPILGVLMSYRPSAAWLGLAVMSITLLSCGAGSRAVDPEDPEITAAVTRILDRAVAASSAADPEGVLSVTTRDDSFTFITDDVMLVGYDQALGAFQETYAMIRSQTNTPIERRVRVIAPDVVLVTAVSEGTYTDHAGYTSPPVGLGSTILFVKREGEWRVIHFHQSVSQ